MRLANCCAVVVDGITRSLIDGHYPSPSPSALLSEWAASRLFTLLSDTQRPLTLSTLRDIAQHLNEGLEHWSSARLPLWSCNDERPGCVLTALVVQNEYLYWLHIGDTFLAKVDVQGHFTRITPDDVATARRWLREHYSTVPESERRRIAQTALRNQPSSPHSFGAFTGEPAAIEYVRTGREELDPLCLYVLGSDGGLDLLVDASGSYDSAFVQWLAHTAHSPTVVERLNERSLRCSTLDDRSLVLFRPPVGGICA